MEQAVVADDGRRLAREAHTLKGSSLNLGAHRVAALCRVLEEGALDERVQQRAGELAAARSAVEKAVQELRSEWVR